MNIKSLLRIDEYYQKQLKIILWLCLILFLLMILSQVLPSINIGKGITGYIPLHIFLETISIIISIVVFAFCWGLDMKDRPENFLFLSSIFFGVALLDFMHTISFKGMPDFITPSGTEKAINFWLSGRLLFTIGMLIIAVRPWKKKEIEFNRWYILLLVLTFVGINAWLILTNPKWIPATFIEGKGLTPFKKNFEYVLIATNFLTSILYLRHLNTKRDYDVVGLFAACFITALSEFYFTFYVVVSDFNNLIGHVYKCIAYAYVYRSIFQDTLRIIIERLNQNEQLLASILDTLPVAVFVKDIKNNYQFKIWNKFAEKLYAIKATDMIGKYDEDFFPRSEAERFHQKDLEALTTHDFVDIPEEVVSTRNGNVIVHTKKKIVRDPLDQPLFLVGVSEDISEIKKMTKNLEDAIKVRDEFLIIASHELKTPITTLKLRLQILQRHFSSNDPMLTETTILLKQVERLIRLMNTILDISHLQSGNFFLELAPMNLNETISAVVEQFSEQLKNSKCQVSIDIKDSIIKDWDRSRVEQILTNLLSNAIKYAPGSLITISSRSNDEYTTIIFKDNGPGIPLENQSALFQQFERAGASLSISGLGLGLFVSKNIIEAMNGTIELQSEPGKGSTFIIKIPNKVVSPLVHEVSANVLH